jgi:HSP20 family protein
MAREKTLAKPEQGEIERVEPWNTFREMERMMRSFFSSPFPFTRPSWWGESRLSTPEVDLKETDKEFVLSAALPGLEKDDIDIDVTKDSITISGERKQEEEKPGERYHVRQQSWGTFKVSYSLPSEIRADQVRASYKNGVLEVTLPKAEVTTAHKVKVEAK